MTVSAPDKITPPPSGVFVCYSREDQEFVQRLAGELRRRGREPWFDLEDIRPAEDFMEAIRPAIEGTDTFVFVISPDSVTSEACRCELAHAAAHNKRMIPIMAREVKDEAVPAPLAGLNRIFARETDSFATATDKLISALDTDLGWVRAHTRFLTRAIEWEGNARSNSFVLRGEDLLAAEKWLEQAGSDKERQPTELQTAYIIASRKDSSRRQRLKLGAATTGLVVALGLAAVAFIFMVRAQTATEEAQKALTASFLRTIGVSEDEQDLPADESVALWELAELAPANKAVRRQVINHWLASEDSLQRAFRRERQGLHAAIGLNVGLRSQFTLKGKELAADLATRLEGPQETDPERLSRLASMLAGLVERMDAALAESLAKSLAKRLADPGETDPNRLSSLRSALAALGSRIDDAVAGSLAESLTKRLEDPEEKDPERLSCLGGFLAELGGQMDPTVAASLAGRAAQALTKRLENPQGTASFRLLSRAVTSALVELAGRMDAAAAAHLAETLVKRLEDPQEMDRSRFSELFAALTKRLDAATASPLAARGARALATRMEELPEETKSEELWRLSNDLISLAEQMEATAAASILARGAQVWVNQLENPRRTTDTRSLMILLPKMARHMDAAAVALLADNLATRLGDPLTKSGLLHLGGTFEQLAVLVDASTAASLADRVVQRLQDPQQTSSERWESLAGALVAITKRADVAAAAPLAARGAIPLVNRLEDPQGTTDRLFDLVAALAGRMDYSAVPPLAESIVNQMEHPVETNSSQSFIQMAGAPGAGYVKFNFSSRLNRLGRVFAALTRRLDATAAPILAARGAEALLKRMEDMQETDLSRLRSLRLSLAELAEHMDAAAAGPLAERLAQRLENPKETDFSRLSSLGEALAAVARRMDPSAGARVAARGAHGLLKQMKGSSQKTDSENLSNLSSALAALAERLPPTRQIRLVALSNMLLTKTPHRARLSASYATLGHADLAGVLKWPLCVGEAQMLALTEMEKKTGQKFDGDLWKFVELAPSLGIKEIEAPAKRPTIEEAQEELERLQPTRS